MPKINTNFNCQLHAEKIKDEVAAKIFQMHGPRPNLAIILIGEREDSKIYVKIKEQEAKKVGIDTHLYKCDAGISETEIFAMIDCLNKDETIDAILVQLPLPDGFDTDGIIFAIDPAKDADRFHPDNLQKFLSACGHAGAMPPVCGAVDEIVKGLELEIKGKQAGVLANSEIFGRSLAKTLQCAGAQAVRLDADDADLAAKCAGCDILVSALGRPHFLDSEHVKEGAVLIDIGISKLDGKTAGDFDFDGVSGKAAFITPVPGGVGPMTVAMLFRNVLKLYRNKNGNSKKKFRH